MITTELALAEELVNTWPSCSISTTVAFDGSNTAPELVVADADVNLTVPKLTKSTSPPSSVKSSTIQSAFAWHRGEVDVRVVETLLRVVTFSMVAVPVVLLVAVTVSLMVSPAEMERVSKYRA